MVAYVAMDSEPQPPKTFLRKVLTSLTFWIIVGTVTGILIGEFAPKFGKDAAPMAQIFLRPIQFIVFPLVFSSLVVGIAGNNDLKQLGRLSIKSFIYFEIVTTLALIVGLLAVNWVQPGSAGITKKGNYTGSPSSTFTFALWINHLTPKTWGEMMGGSGSSELLQVLVASILVGVATAKTHQPHKRVIVELATAVMEMMFKFVDIVIWTAPLGVCFAVANAIGANGVGALAALGALVATLYGTLVVFIVVIFGPIFFFFKINPIEFLSAMREPLVIAYTTATSEAALPKVFECLLRFGVSPHISAFVAAGIEKSVGEQITMVLMLMISSKGVAGVRSASIIVLASTVDQFNIPNWPVALLLGADWLMDMARTFTNVFGNCLASVVMAKLEGEFRKDGWEKALESSEDSYVVEDQHTKVLEDGHVQH
ncbi:dicarboxylate/amino acid:cation (Na or H) symporter (DAACS) family protein [Achlya hypogyna]|uniref:Amino acid transporter n=1 Tax=Achlya hypogyna TaxID=1202772 RepID=A0A1V9YV36_ACHHY|nr:dicarboxylate/amino acid:cation (Na or H) symporter (DAACS) family protein [Achlya hypogyna]